MALVAPLDSVDGGVDSFKLEEGIGLYNVSSTGDGGSQGGGGGGVPPAQGAAVGGKRIEGALWAWLGFVAVWLLV